MNTDYPILNGVAPSWADIVVKLTPEGGSVLDIKDIKAINTGRSLEVGEQRGAGGRVMRRTIGQPSQEASMTLYRSGLQKLLRALLPLAPRRANQAMISLVHFDIQIQHSVPHDDEIYERIVRGARVTGDTLNAAEGSDAQEAEVPLSVIEIVDIIDGVEVVLV